MRKSVLILLLLTAIGLGAAAQERIWDGTRCNARGVTLTAFKAQGEPRASVIVCPGGSYHWLDWEAEGVKVAQWLSENGFDAYVLRYRVAGKFEFAAKYRTVIRGHRHPDMICDIQRAIQLVRSRSSQPLGVMGFSAGGHLVMSAGAYSSTNFLSRYGIEPEVSLRPDFVVPVYPVVTMREKGIVHRRSRLGLLGEWSELSPRLRDSLSLERHIGAGTPPVFLVNCNDDPIVDYRNSILLDSALTASSVPHRYIRYSSGGHGFGADKTRQNAETSCWQESFLNWMKENGY